MDSCAIHITPEAIASGSTLQSCLSLESLRRIADAYNYKKGKVLIKMTDSITKAQLWKLIQSEMNDICKKGDEVCWINKSGAEKTLIDENFKPKKPKGKYTWLSNVDIEKLMIGQQKKHNPYFKFYGPVPSDFDKIITELNGTNLKLTPQIRKVGMITNLDPHHKSGSHWTAFFLDLDNRSIEYFDSLGEKPFKTMETYMNNLKAWLKMNMDLDTQIKINTKEFQKEFDGDCGIWSVWYIMQRLGGKSFEEIVSMDFTEEKINKCRDVYFRK